MPFSSSFVNPHLEDEFLLVTIGDKPQEFDLDTCLGNVRGKFQWGGQDFFSSARSLSLRGSVLSGELKRKNDWVKDEIDLGDRIQDVNGQPTFVASKLDNFNGLSAPIFGSSKSTTVSETDTIVSETNFVEELKAFKSSHQSTYSERSSSFFKFSIKSLSLQGSRLLAEARQAGQEGLISSELDLDDYIGLADDKLVWGRTGFSSAVTNIRLDGFILIANFEGSTTSIDLSRYLQTYNGKLGAKVTVTSDELSGFFSEAPWMKFKITAEPAAAEVFSLISGEKSVFKAAFSALAETTAKQIVEEMAEEYTAEAEQFVKSAVTARVREEINKVISQKLSKQIEDEITIKVKETFAEAQKSVIGAFEATQEAALEACKALVQATSSELTVEYTEAVVATLTEQITSQWKSVVQNLLTEVSTSTVAQFQERVEILMEREIIGAKIRRVETQANLLQTLFEKGV